MDNYLACLLAGLLGLTFGSFLNVCIYRIPRSESLAFPASHCPSCQHPLRWFDNVPLAGWLRLGGRCRDCRQPISVMYPLVEAATGVLFAAGCWYYGVSLLLVARLVFACAMIVLCVIDLQHRILPNVITLPGIVVGFLFSLVLPPGWLASLIGIAVGGGLLLLVSEVYLRVRGEEGLGMGDVKMLAMIGAFLGWKLTLLTLVLSSLVGSLVGLGMIAARKGGLKYALPFGTFLALAAIVAAAVGDSIVTWYLSFYGTGHPMP
jgi:leader peptidase (prepilin peptidase) / N-methyltransferase